MCEQDFLVQVTCMTYNHVNYITDAMNGFVMQQTLFPFVCIIVDDASTDGEPDVIKKYLDDYFEKREIGLATEEETDEYLRIYAQHKENKSCFFCVLLLKYNHYSTGKTKTKNLAGLAPSKKYIALCEGDDYWTDPYKLQKQVDFMEMHPECVACFHNARVQYRDHLSLFNGLEEKHDISAKDIIKRQWFIATPTLLYRNINLTMPEWSKTVVNGDYLLELLLAREGKFYYMDDVMSVYRQDGLGMSAVLQENAVNMVDRLIDLLNKMKPLYGDEYAAAFDESIDNYQRLRAGYAKEAYYEAHPLARLLRPKTYKRMIKKWLRRIIK